MLDHPHSPSGGNQGGGGRDIDGIRAIATGSRGVHEALTSNGKGVANFQECLGGTRDIREGFAAGTDMGQ